jgi:hypothetical protein
MPAGARTIRVFLIAGLLAPLLGMVQGCSAPRADGPGWVDPATPYAGPEVQLGRSGEMHGIRVLAPTSGWTLTGDRVELGHMAGSAFLTLRRPDPEMMHAQAIEELDVAIGVPAHYGLSVYIRVVEFDASADTEPYRLVESALAPPDPAAEPG